MSHSSERPSKSTSQEDAYTRTHRMGRAKRMARSGALVVGLTAVAVGGVHAAMGDEVISGHAVASAERYETEAMKYYNSGERNTGIGRDAEKFAMRIINKTNKQPELPVRFEDFDPVTGKEDGRGILKTTISEGSRTYDFSVSVKKGPKGIYEFDTRDSSVKATYYEPSGKPNETRFEGASLNKHGDERDDGQPTWDASAGSGTQTPDGSHKSSLVSSLETAQGPTITPEDMIEAERFSVLKMNEIMAQAGV